MSKKFVATETRRRHRKFNLIFAAVDKYSNSFEKKLDDEGMGEKSVEITIYWKIFSSCLAYTYARIQFQTFFISILFQFAEIC